MSQPKKPKASKSEQAQAQLSNDMFQQGKSISSETAQASRGDARYNPAGKQTSMARAQGAEMSKQKTIAARKQGGTRIMSVNDLKQSMAMMSQTAAGGVTNSAPSVSRSIASTSGIAGTMSGIGQRTTMRNFQRKNERTQALIDVGTAAGQAYMYSDPSSPAGPKGTNAADYSGDEYAAWVASQGNP